MSQQIAKMLVYMLNVSNILTIKLCPTAAQTLRAAISLSSQSQTHVHTHLQMPPKQYLASR